MSGIVTLQDLLGADEYVEISRGRIATRGLGVGEVLDLIARYPVLQVDDGVKISAPALIRSAPAAVPEIIALACGMPGKSGQDAARRLSAPDQALIIEAVIERTLPAGPGPFVETLARIMQKISGA